jgi:hypothetical protein
VKRALGRLGAAVAVLMLLGAGIALALLSRRPSETPHSVESTGSDGWRAAFALLEELGLAPRVWKLRPGLLPSGRQLLVLPRVPIDPRETDLEDDEDEPRAVPDSLDLAQVDSLRSPRHYGRFLEQGGLVVAALSQDMLDYLRDEVGIAALDGAEVEPLEPAPGRVRMLSGEQLELGLESGSRLTGLDPDLRLTVHAGTLRGETVALELPVGGGALVLLASDGFLDNSRLREADHALFFVRLVERLAPQEGILFDEHALGVWSEAGTLALAFSPDLRLLTLHLALLALLATWALTWAREFPRDPAALAVTSPLERARGISALALRADRPGVLGRELVRGTLQRIAQRLRTPLPEGETARRSLERLRAAAGLPESAEQLERWNAELLQGKVRARDDLARLDAGLRELERELAGTAASPSARLRPAAAAPIPPA